MSVQVKVSDEAHKFIIKKKGELISRKGRNFSIIETVDILLGIKSGRSRMKKAAARC